MRHLTPILLTAAGLVLHGCSNLEQMNLGGLWGRGNVAVKKLRCEYRANPLGIDTIRPRLSWTVESKQRGQMQTGYQILVASSKDKLSKNQGDLWDTGKVDSDNSIQVIYAGEQLKSRVQCYWKVRVWDKDEKVSAWSKPAFWTMGLLQASDWQAKWIGFDKSRKRKAGAGSVDLKLSKWIWYPEGDPKQSAPVGIRLFRKTFPIPSDRKIKQAACAATADNRFSLFLNGQRILQGSSFQEAPAADVTDQLRQGTNVLAVEAANEGDSANPAGLIAVLKIEFESGPPIVIATGGDWKTRRGKTARFMDADFDDAQWEMAQVAGDHGVDPWKEIKIAPSDLFLPPVQFLRKPFAVTKSVDRAVVYASALGNYELHINGQPVDDAYFTPGWTDYDVRVYYNTFEVTKCVQKGDNVIGALLADGWYSGHIGWKHIRDHYGKDPRLAIQLHIDYADGSSEILATDHTWKATTGPILEADFLMGETHDARKEIPDWCKASLDDTKWEPVDVTEEISAKIQSYPGVLVREFKEIKPVEITEPKEGAYVLDMGTNFAGFVRLKVSGEPGTKVILRFAERLNPDGTIYTTNLRGARVIDTYICKGDGDEIWQPRFTFHGFQYVEVTGYPGKFGADAITGVELTSATPAVGSFECSDKMANTLYRNICQTQRANFIDIPTDCPQRDERLGWMGDAQIYVRTATYNSDVAAFFNKWLVDVEDAQLPNGAFSDVAPRRVAMAGGTAAWGDAGVVCPWTIYQVYGDTRVLEKHYDAMERWIEYCKGTAKQLLRPAQGYGDWLSIKADTPKDVLATAYFAYSTKLTAKIAEVLGKKQDAAQYSRLYEEIKKAFNEAYVSEDGRIKGETQTVYVLALAFDLLPKQKRAQATRYLVDDIKSRGWHLSTGFVGTKDLMMTLTRFGQTDVAYRLFHNDTFPSWGFSIKHGATSIWERWDGWTPEKGFQDPGMNSFAHYSFGAVAEWMFRTICGIDTDGPAYKHIVIHPRPGGKLTYAKASYESIHGKIATDWKIKDHTFKLSVTIPANTTATVYVPAKSPESVTEGGRPPAKAKGVQLLRMEDGDAVLAVGSGRYRFESKLAN
ncbi:MAG: family 78 glycoside hydrolase catalytic domain [Phycisphaerales bacterium]|nr:MAG: family 78 glycoside hydrolase catalytic domain [Phycisphaerales bacterium]